VPLYGTTLKTDVSQSGYRQRICDDVNRSRKGPRCTMNKGKNTLEKNICHCKLIQFSLEHVMLNTYDVLIFYMFTTVES